VALRARLADAPPLPEIGPTWVELVPTDALDLSDPADVERLDDWLRLVAALGHHDHPQLVSLGYPEKQLSALDRAATQAAALLETGDAPAALAAVVARLARVTLLPVASPSRVDVWREPLPDLEPGAAQLAATPGRALVTRVLRELDRD
jgi:hypothetical protein